MAEVNVDDVPPDVAEVVVVIVPDVTDVSEVKVVVVVVPDIHSRVHCCFCYCT